MQADKLTNKFQEALSDAQSMALGRDHQLIEPGHLMLTLIDQPENWKEISETRWELMKTMRKYENQ